MIEAGAREGQSEGLGHRARGDGYRLIRHATVTSTMDEASALGRDGDPGRVWIVADRQTGGRGRQARPWVSEAGNLYATLLLIDPAQQALAAQLSFVSALALRDALAPLIGGAARVLLKWPNDILAGGAKLTGILLESMALPLPGQPRRYGVSIGCGVNVAHAPEGLRYPTASLKSLGVATSPMDVLARLSDAMIARLEQWSAGRNFAAVRHDWMAAAAGLGDDIEVRLPDRVLRGRFTEIDEAGRLLLVTDGGTQAIDAGDVMLKQKAA